MSEVLFDSMFTGLQQVLDLRSEQHSLTATNLANTDTPGFKAKYIPFQEVLGEAMGSPNKLPIQRSSDRHVFGIGGNPVDPDVEEIAPPPWAQDGNSVNQETESTRLTENALLYKGVTRGLSRRLGILRYASLDGKIG